MKANDLLANAGNASALSYGLRARGETITSVSDLLQSDLCLPHPQRTQQAACVHEKRALSDRMHPIEYDLVCRPRLTSRAYNFFTSSSARRWRRFWRTAEPIKYT
eukprot:scaffold124755_cov33-Tisochrysis_lutea.AAC.3